MMLVGLDSSVLIDACVHGGAAEIVRRVGEGNALWLSPRVVYESARGGTGLDNLDALRDAVIELGTGRAFVGATAAEIFARERRRAHVRSGIEALPRIERLILLDEVERERECEWMLGSEAWKEFTRSARHLATKVAPAKFDNEVVPPDLHTRDMIRAFTLSENDARSPIPLPEEEHIARIRRQPEAHRAAVVARAYFHLKSIAIAFVKPSRGPRQLNGSDPNDWVDGLIAAECAYVDRFYVRDTNMAETLRRIHRAFDIAQDVRAPLT